MNICIVRLQEKHIPKVAQLERECFSEPWSEKSLMEELSNPMAHFFVALYGDEVVGYSGMYAVLGEGYINNIAVFSQYRGKGIGKQLTQQLIQQAKETDLDFISLEVRSKNSLAINMYCNLAFVEQGLRKNFYSHPNDDAVIMTRSFR